MHRAKSFQGLCYKWKERNRGSSWKKERHFGLVCYDKKNHYKLMENLNGERELMMQGEKIATAKLLRR